MPVPRWRRALPWASVGALAAGLALVLVLWAPWRAAAPPRVTRTTITTSGPAALTINGTDRDLALSPDGTHVVYVGNKRHAALRPRARCARTGGDRQRRRRAGAIRLAGWPVGRLRRRRQHAPEGRDHGRPADHARQPRRRLPRRDVGARRHDHLRDQQPGDGAAARVGRRWDAGGADAARPRAGRSRPPLAGNLARRPRRPLHDHVADGRAR